MNAFLTRSVVPRLAVASTLAAGFLFVWLAATMAAYATVAPLFPIYLYDIDDKTTAFAWLMAIYTLSPLASGVLLFGIEPLMEMSKFRNHPELLNLDWLANYRVPMLVACSIWVLVAIYFYWRHQSKERRGALAWAAFIFLWGMPGIVAYLMHRTWPAREVCEKCGKASPRDREACLHCNAEFPAPATKGIEIFA